MSSVFWMQMECQGIAECKKKMVCLSGKTRQKFVFTPLLYSEIFRIYTPLFFQIQGIFQCFNMNIIECMPNIMRLHGNTIECVKIDCATTTKKHGGLALEDTTKICFHSIAVQ